MGPMAHEVLSDGRHLSHPGRLNFSCHSRILYVPSQHQLVHDIRGIKCEGALEHLYICCPEFEDTHGMETLVMVTATEG